MAEIVSILGCGWLGLPLAKELISSGYTVKGSSTAADKIPMLQENGIDAFLLECYPDLSGRNIKQFFESDVAVVTIPFRRNLSDHSFYKKQILSCIQCIENSSVKFAIFTSSTSVYPDDVGVVNESDIFQSQTPRAKILFEIEQLFLNNEHFDATVIRFAGLYGAGRNIGKFLSGKRELGAGNSPVNLIHQDDCVSILKQVIQQDVRGEILNACSDHHPTREALYTAAALKLNIPPPVFDKTAAQKNKIVSNAKMKELLNYQFRHPDPLAL